MNFPPIHYAQINGPVQRDALESLSEISKLLVTRADIILDVGSGSGEVSTMVADAIPHKRYIALDVDPKMLEFHAANHHRNSMEYVQQDFGAQFEHLDSSLQKLEGQVDFILSNFTFQWIPPASRKNVANNIAKLLRPGCSAYLNIICLSDKIFKYCKDPEIKNYFRVPSGEEQVDAWKKELFFQGLTLLQLRSSKRMWAFKTAEEFRRTSKLSKVYEIYCSDQLVGTDRIRVLESLEEPFLRYYGIPHDGKGVKESRDNAKLYYELMTFVVRR